MSSSIKKAACQSLVDVISAQMPEIDVDVLTSDYEQDAVYPSVRVLPGRFRTVVGQTVEVDSTGSLTTNLVEIGGVFGRVEIVVAGEQPEDREDLEERVYQCFFLQQGYPGQVITSFPMPELGGVSWPDPSGACFDLVEEEWREEMVYTKRRRSYLTVDCAFPLLVTRNAAPMLRKLYLDLAQNDVTSTLPVEETQVNPPGTVPQGTTTSTGNPILPPK